MLQERLRRAAADADIETCPGLDKDDPVYQGFLSKYTIDSGKESVDLTEVQLENLKIYNNEHQSKLNLHGLIAEGVILLLAMIAAVLVYRRVIERQKEEKLRIAKELKDKRQEALENEAAQKIKDDEKLAKEQLEVHTQEKVDNLYKAKEEEYRKNEVLVIQMGEKIQTKIRKLETKGKELQAKDATYLARMQTYETELNVWTPRVASHKRMNENVIKYEENLVTARATVETKRELKTKTEAELIVKEEQAVALNKERITLARSFHDKVQNTGLKVDVDELAAKWDIAEAKRVMSSTKVNDLKEASTNLPTLFKELERMKKQEAKDGAKRKITETKLKAALEKDLITKEELDAATDQKRIKAQTNHNLVVLRKQAAIDLISQERFDASEKIKAASLKIDYFEELQEVEKSGRFDWTAQAVTDAEEFKATDETLRELLATRDEVDANVAEVFNQLLQLNKDIAIDKTTVQGLAKQLAAYDVGAGEAKEKDEIAKIEGQIKRAKTRIRNYDHDEIICIGTVERVQKDINANNTKIRTNRNAIDNNNRELRDINKKHGVDTSTFETLEKEYKAEKAVLSKIQEEKLAIATAVNEGEQLRKQIQIEKRYADIKNDILTSVDIQVMTPKLAAEIARTCAIKCDHKGKDVVEALYGDAEDTVGTSPAAATSLVSTEKACKHDPICDSRRCVIDNQTESYLNGDDPNVAPEPRRGDYIVWKRGQKGSEVLISVYDSVGASGTYQDYKVIKLIIDEKEGCLMQEGSNNVVKGGIITHPAGFVGLSLVAAFQKDQDDKYVANIRYYDPKNHTEIKLQRRLFVSTIDDLKIQRDIYADKKIYILLFGFELFDWMSDWGTYTLLLQSSLF
jgi:hypothetical protein